MKAEFELITNSPILTHVICLHLRTDVVNAKINRLFVTEYIESSADRIPNEDKYCLPTCLTKREIYLTYVDELKTAGMRPVSWATFSRMWKKQFRNVIIPKVSTRSNYVKVVQKSFIFFCVSHMSGDNYSKIKHSYCYCLNYHYYCQQLKFEHSNKQKYDKLQNISQSCMNLL